MGLRLRFGGPPPYSSSRISDRTVALLDGGFGNEFFFHGGKICALSIWKLLGPLPPSPMPIPDLSFCLWDSSCSFSPYACLAPTFRGLQNTAQPRGMTRSEETQGEQRHFSWSRLQGAGPRPAGGGGVCSNPLGSAHTLSWLGGNLCRTPRPLPLSFGPLNLLNLVCHWLLPAEHGAALVQEGLWALASVSQS